MYLHPLIFQSTLPRGSDPSQRQQRCRADHFNPRSLAGATSIVLHITFDFAISIHAPSRERHTANTHALRHLLFQSTLPRGSDSAILNLDVLLSYFNPRSLAGATKNLRSKKNSKIFQSTLPRGSDVVDLLSHAQRRKISIHAPSRERRTNDDDEQAQIRISIHAPSRERLQTRIDKLLAR